MLSKLFPTYNVIFSSRGKIKIRPTKIYVDIPFEVYYFVSYLQKRISAMKNRPQTLKEFVRTIWKNFLMKYKEVLCNEKGKPIVSIFFRPHRPQSPHSPSSSYHILQIRIRWEDFFQYLEDRARKKIEEMLLSEQHEEKEQKRIGKEFKKIYDEEIMRNFLHLSKLYEEFKNVRIIKWYPKDKKSLVNFLRVLKYFTTDYYEILRYFDFLEELILKLDEKLVKEAENWRLLTHRIGNDYYNLLEAWERIDIQCCYLYLRNMLELFVEIFIFQSILEAFDKKEKDKALSILLEAERFGKIKKMDSIKKEEIVKNIREILSLNKFDVEEISKKISVLIPQISFDLIKELEIKSNKTAYRLEYLWSICSELVHSQQPLPFYSLYEVKLFKHFFKYYLLKVSNFLEIEINIKDVSNFRESRVNFHKISSTFRKISSETKSIIKTRIENFKTNNPQLFSLLKIWFGDSVSHIYTYTPVYDDFREIIEKINLLSPRPEWDFKEKLISVFENIKKDLAPLLQSLIPETKMLNEKEMETLIFWLLLELS